MDPRPRLTGPSGGQEARRLRPGRQGARPAQRAGPPAPHARTAPRRPLSLFPSTPTDQERAAERPHHIVPGPASPPEETWGRSGAGGPARRRPHPGTTPRPTAGDSAAGMTAHGPAGRLPELANADPEGRSETDRRPHHDRRSLDLVSVFRGQEARRTGHGRPEATAANFRRPAGHRRSLRPFRAIRTTGPPQNSRPANQVSMIDTWHSCCSGCQNHPSRHS